MTTKAEIASWLAYGKERRCAYVVVLCDTFDSSDYPVYCQTAAEARTAIESAGEKRMIKVMECYDLALDIDTQLAERRARHDPPAEEKKA